MRRVAVASDHTRRPATARPGHHGLVRDRVLVRAATTDDVEAIHRIYAPVVRETATSFEETPPERTEMTRRMQARPRLPWLVAETEALVAGYAYASPHRSRPAYRWSVECSVFVDGPHHRRGVGRALYGRLVDEVRHLGYVSMYAGVVLPNPASVALHLAVGFEPVGVYRQAGHKLGAWHDVGWWELRLTDPPLDPTEPAEWRPRHERSGP